MKLEKALSMKLSPPWISYHRMVLALFGGDPEVQVRDLFTDDDTNYRYLVLCSTAKKASAIKALLKVGKFNDITITAVVYGPDENSEAAPAEKLEPQLVEDAFVGNPLFVEMVNRGGPFAMSFCVFAREVVQYWNDNLGDLWGFTSTIAENIAREVLNDVERVAFCTNSM